MLHFADNGAPSARTQIFVSDHQTLIQMIWALIATVATERNADRLG
jgi:hypothetical protein